MKVKKAKTVLLAAVTGAVLAVVFSGLGSVSPEPSDHALDPTGGLIPFLLLPFCFPAFLLHAYLVLPILWLVLPYERFGRLGECLETFVTYPALQGTLYGALAWLGLGALDRFRNRKKEESGSAQHGESDMGDRRSRASGVRE